MKTKIFSHNPLITAIISILFGTLLIVLRNEFLNIILIAFGWLLITLSLIKFIIFIRQTSKTENRWAYLPFSVILMAVIGILFIVSPEFWVSLGGIVIAVMILILALGKLTLLVQLKSNGVKINFFSFIIPSVIFICSIIAIIEPEFILGSVTTAFGVLMVFFGISEIIDYFFLGNKQLNKKFGSISIDDDQYIEAEVIDEQDDQKDN